MNWEREHAENIIIEEVYQAFLTAMNKQREDGPLNYDEVEWQYMAVRCSKRILEGAEISLQAKVVGKEVKAILDEEKGKSNG